MEAIPAVTSVPAKESKLKYPTNCSSNKSVLNPLAPPPLAHSSTRALWALDWGRITTRPISQELRNSEGRKAADGRVAFAGPKFVPYNTSKGAVLMLTRSLSVDLAEYGIRVNAVCPGSIHTSATYKHIEHMGTDVEKTLKEFQEGSLLKRQGRPEEVAKAVLFLASYEDSSFITGENIIVDGGLIYT